MKIFIDIGHPAHVHYFKNLIRIMEKKHNAKFIITARDKEMSHYLLSANKFIYKGRGKGKDSVIGKLFYMLKADLLIYRLAKKHKPDLFMSFGAPYASQVSFFMRIPSITIDDTENASLGQIFYRPFSTLILSPNTFYKDFGKKHIKFNGYMEISYLHNNYFKPDSSVLIDLKLKKNETYTILRFVKWRAHHDIGHSGISKKNKVSIVNELLKFGKVFISSEDILPKEIEKYRIKIDPVKIHSVLYFAKLFYGESATMASESAVLGTPAIYIDNDGRGYTNELESKYKIVFNFSETEKDQKKSIIKAKEIMSSYSKYNWDKKREKILSDKIDVTNFLMENILKFSKKIKKDG